MKYNNVRLGTVHPPRLGFLFFPHFHAPSSSNTSSPIGSSHITMSTPTGLIIRVPTLAPIHSSTVLRIIFPIFIPAGILHFISPFPHPCPFPHFTHSSHRDVFPTLFDAHVSHLHYAV